MGNIIYRIFYLWLSFEIGSIHSDIKTVIKFVKIYTSQVQSVNHYAGPGRTICIIFESEHRAFLRKSKKKIYYRIKFVQLGFSV